MVYQGQSRSRNLDTIQFLQFLHLNDVCMFFCVFFCRGNSSASYVFRLGTIFFLYTHIFSGLFPVHVVQQYVFVSLNGCVGIFILYYNILGNPLVHFILIHLTPYLHISQVFLCQKLGSFLHLFRKLTIFQYSLLH